ncbi:hypothetical protein [Desulfitobacterium hafniense]|uniref:hypothetical protein n=1 Tax=Desulfitobacterium hafniense TaxID=49338 RepID=UPI00059BCD5F|nr:hypothetical protein [Desulfitobacterium hafniense]
MSETKKIGMLLRTDNCIGCQACQVACREENGFGYNEIWLELIRRKPSRIDGKLSTYHLVAPPLDKCSLCVKKDHDPLCTTICPPRCLYVGEGETLKRLMDGKGRWQLVQ